MDFSPTEAQTDLAALTREILADRVTPERLRELDAAPQRFDRELWSALAGAGVLAAALPAAAGGDDLGVLEQCSVAVELGRAVAPVPYLASIVMGAAAVARFGDDAQRARWAAPAGAGRLVLTAALDGAPHGAQPAAATRGPDGRWTLTGTVATVPAGPVADAVLVPAATDEGATVFVVETGDAGVAVATQSMVDGDDAGWIELTGVELDADRVLGGVGAAAAVTAWLTARATVALCAAQLGVTERALELTASYARTRVQFDRPIGAFQAVAQRLADAYVDVQAIRLTLWQAAWQLDAGRPADAAVATAKFWAADGGHRVAHAAVHVHGGVGLDLDHHVHRYFTAAKRNEFTLGGATAQLRTLGDLLARA
ncbi:acyl-CoA dehydrogenase family protein [Pseudonocardia humida]|uniref:Acyl-CoA dehydrogenase family protein n=1 Tax=Pseudonocardia humida TaxID=2800819 RepID=A0ABT0ZXJ5_9PSEU|nr:acyl-CoA dehydrogenase family protein [Pseudonocardia humida]MCO1655472.1 acyl-CoA dehydrogenase family protein [Pseudonocardia humida]